MGRHDPRAGLAGFLGVTVLLLLVLPPMCHAFAGALNAFGAMVR